MSRTVGIVPGSFKPYHAGHDALVRMAASENDVVYLLASTASRGSASGDIMSQIWEEYILPTLPSNVISDVSGGSPVKKVYDLLKQAEAEGSDDVFRIYSDEFDISKFTPEKLKKAAPTLYGKDSSDETDPASRIELRGVSRGSTVNVSGTAMRKYLETGDTENFIANLPPAIQDRGQEIFKKLSGEKTLREYVRSVFSII